MPESFGAQLRQRRERQQIALTTIAEQTKIKVSLLEGLERDDVSHWPVGIFGRAFIRAYAHAIGLEPGVVLREFLALHPDPNDVGAAAATMAPSDGSTDSARPPTRLRFLVGSAIGSLSRGRDEVVNQRGSGRDDVAAALASPAAAPTPFEPDLAAAAHLCTELGRSDERHEVAALLSEVARILDAAGLVLWVWDSQADALRPAMAHGYSDKVLAQLPTVTRDADNATAAAFRSGHTCVVDGSDRARGALVVPLMASRGCVGVLAMEMQNRSEQTESVRALVTIFAAQLARGIRTERPVEVPDRRLA